MDIFIVESYCSRGECEYREGAISEDLFNKLSSMSDAERVSDLPNQTDEGIQLLIDLLNRQPFTIDMIKHKGVLAYIIDDSTFTFVSLNKDLPTMVKNPEGESLAKYLVNPFYDWEQDPDIVE